MTESAGTEVEIIILDLDGGSMLVECLASIERQTVKPARVILFDNGSKDPVENRVSETSLEILIRRSEVNLGVAGGFNAAMKLVERSFTGFVNNDAVLDAHWIETLVATMESDDRIGAVQSIVMGEGGMVDGTGIEVVDGRFVQRDHGGSLEDAATTPPWGISATAALFRTAALREAALPGGEVFHPSLFAYYEDVELAARLNDLGWKNGYVGEPLAHHKASRSAGALGSRGEKLRIRNRYWVSRLHPGVGSRSALVAEDVRRMAGLALSGRWMSAIRVPSAVLTGLFGTIER